jgi:hypothetical protein
MFAGRPYPDNSSDSFRLDEYVKSSTDDLNEHVNIADDVDKLVKLLPEEVQNLVFGGGGAAGLAYAGALWRMAQIPGFNFDNIRRAAGTSIGAVAALAVCLKLTPQQMLERLSSIDFKKLKDPGTPWEVGKRVLWEKKHYAYKGDLIYTHVLQLLQDVTGRSDPEKITFQDLKRAGYKDLYVVAGQLINSKPQPTTVKKIYSYETTPKASVAAAIRASTAALPLFRSMKIDGYDCVDGGWKDNLASGIFDYPKYMRKFHTNDDSGYFHGGIRYSREMYDYENRRLAMKNRVIVDRQHNPHTLIFSLVNSDSAEPFFAKDIVSTGKALLNGALTKDDNTLDPRNDRVIEIQRKIELLDFGINDDKQMEIMIDGSKAVSQYFEQPHDAVIDDSLKLSVNEIKASVNSSKSESLNVRYTAQL